MAARLSAEQVQLCLAMTEAAARDFTPQAYAQDFTGYAQVFTALGHPPDFDPKAADADSSGALDILLLDSLGLAALGNVAFYVLRVLIDMGIEKSAEYGAERLWHRLRRRRGAEGQGGGARADAEGPVAPAPAAASQPDVAELVTTVTARLPRTWAGQDAATLTAVVEVQVKTYLTTRNG